jgi:hypothetical protein
MSATYFRHKTQHHNLGMIFLNLGADKIRLKGISNLSEKLIEIQDNDQYLGIVHVHNKLYTDRFFLFMLYKSKQLTRLTIERSSWSNDMIVHKAIIALKNHMEESARDKAPRHEFKFLTEFGNLEFIVADYTHQIINFTGDELWD